MKQDELPTKFSIKVVEECSNFFLALHNFTHEYGLKLKKVLRRNMEESKDMEKDQKKKKIRKLNKYKQLNPYMKYFLETSKNLKEDEIYKNFDGKKLSKFISKKWASLPKEEKTKWTQKCEQEKKVKENKTKSNISKTLDDDENNSSENSSSKNSIKNNSLLKVDEDILNKYKTNSKE
jgi:hypothetical protein